MGGGAKETKKDFLTPFPKVGKLRSGVFEAEEGEEKEQKQVQLKEICSSNICTIELVYDEL